MTDSCNKQFQFEIQSPKQYPTPLKCVDRWLISSLYDECNYLFMLGSKLIHVNIKPYLQVYVFPFQRLDGREKSKTAANRSRREAVLFIIKIQPFNSDTGNK